MLYELKQFSYTAQSALYSECSKTFCTSIKCDDFSKENYIHKITYQQEEEEEEEGEEEEAVFTMNVRLMCRGALPHNSIFG